MSFHTCKTFVHLRNRNEDIFDEIWEVYDSSIDSNLITTFKIQKGTKDIVKTVDVTAVVQP